MRWQKPHQKTHVLLVLALERKQTLTISCLKPREPQWVPSSTSHHFCNDMTRLGRTLHRYMGVRKVRKCFKPSLGMSHHVLISGADGLPAVPWPERQCEIGSPPAWPNWLDTAGNVLLNYHLLPTNTLTETSLRRTRVPARLHWGMGLVTRCSGRTEAPQPRPQSS